MKPTETPPRKLSHQENPAHRHSASNPGNCVTNSKCFPNFFSTSRTSSAKAPFAHKFAGGQKSISRHSQSAFAYARSTTGLQLMSSRLKVVFCLVFGGKSLSIGDSRNKWKGRNARPKPLRMFPFLRAFRA